MTLLTRYLLAQLLRYFLTLNIGFSALYLLIDFFEKFDEFAEAGKPMSLVIKFFLLNIPFVVDQLSPILILLSGVITLGILNHNNELVALKAAGVPLRTIVKPILLGGLLLTTLFIAIAQLILPSSITTTNDIWYEQVRGKVPLGIFQQHPGGELGVLLLAGCGPGPGLLGSAYGREHRRRHGDDLR